MGLHSFKDGFKREEIRKFIIVSNRCDIWNVGISIFDIAVVDILDDIFMR